PTTRRSTSAWTAWTPTSSGSASTRPAGAARRACGSGLLAPGGGGRHLRPHVAVVPGDVALVAVLHVAGPPDAVVLAGIDHELRLAAEPAQRLVELLGVEEGHVHVVRPAHEQRRGGHLLDGEPGRELHPALHVLPGQAQLGLPLVLV